MFTFSNIAAFNNVAKNMANGNGYEVKGYEFIWDDKPNPRHKMK
jgi:hypothetical protein